MDPEQNLAWFDGEKITHYLSRISIPVTLLFLSDWLNKDKCEQMRRLLEQATKDKEFQGKIKFLLVNADEQGSICRELSVAEFPVLIIFKKGKEQARFKCPTSKPAIYYHLAESLRPSKPHVILPVIPWF